MSDYVEITEGQAKALVLDVGVVEMRTQIDGGACLEFALKDGRVLTMYDASDEFPRSWELRGVAA